MKQITLTLIFLCAFTIKSLSNDLLQKAEKAYDSKNYKEAIVNYEKLIGQGFNSYQLYFNLGNAYYRNDELGKAIYNYELARKLNPNDEDVRINLGMASAKTIDKISSKENFFISAVKTNLLSSFSTNLWAWFSILTLSVACVLFFVYINSTKLLVKRISFSLVAVLAIMFFATYFLGYSSLISKKENKYAVVLIKEVKIMNEPTPSANSKFSLHEGTKIKLIENNGNWLLIKLDNGNEGWVKTTDVGVI